MAPIIDPEEDYLTILSAEEQIALTEAKRKKELEDAQANLKCMCSYLAICFFIIWNGKWCPKYHFAHEYHLALSRVLDAARVSSTRPSSVPSAEAHAAKVNELDVTRLSFGKAISDAEGYIASKEAELAALKEEMRGLEDCDPAVEHEKELDGTSYVTANP